VEECKKIMKNHAATIEGNNPPNILVFLTDDHAQWAARCYGNSELVTPTFDFLAATGARMQNAYTPCPVCSPARASFWTGMTPSQHGIHDWIQEPVHPKAYLEGQETLAQVLQKAGYQTGFVGKWHCGQSWVKQPGFDYYLGENKEQYPHKGKCLFRENNIPVEYTGQRSAFVTQKACDYLEQRDQKQPFFLFVGYVDTHSPFKDHPERWEKYYETAKFSDIPKESYKGNATRLPGLLPKDPKEQRRRLIEYYASVSYIDEQVGQVLDKLSAQGDLDNTLIVYTSDHGHMNGHHGLYYKGNATSPQNFYEESIKVPCLLRWPGHVPAASVHTEFVDHCDLHQTLREAAGLSPQENVKSPGMSYLRLLPVIERLWRGAQFCEYGNARMVRTDAWKLIVRYAPHDALNGFGDELYDMKNDPRETKNVIKTKKNAAILAELRERLDAHFSVYENPLRSGKNVATQPPFNPNMPWSKG
jgi:choline-sulfatase